MSELLLLSTSLFFSADIEHFFLTKVFSFPFKRPKHGEDGGGEEESSIRLKVFDSSEERKSDEKSSGVESQLSIGSSS